MKNRDFEKIFTEKSNSRPGFRDNSKATKNAPRSFKKNFTQTRSKSSGGSKSSSGK